MVYVYTFTIICHFSLHIYDFDHNMNQIRLSPVQGLYGLYDIYFRGLTGGIRDYTSTGNRLKFDYQGKPTLVYDGFRILITSFKGTWVSVQCDFVLKFCPTPVTSVADCINISYFIQWIRDNQWITLSNLVMLSNLDNPLYKTILGYLTFG